MSEKFWIGAAIIAAVALPVSIVIRAMRRRKSDIAYATEVAVHWPDLDPAGSAAPLVRTVDLENAAASQASAPARTIGMADFARGGITTDDVRCNHRHDAYQRIIMLSNVKIGIADDVPACADCVSAFLVEHGLRCASCKQFLLPGDDVARTEPGKAVSTAFEHLRLGCCDDIDRYCGRWGKGKLIPLSQLYPGAFIGGDAEEIGRDPFSRRRRGHGSA